MSPLIGSSKELQHKDIVHLMYFFQTKAFFKAFKSGVCLHKLWWFFITLKFKSSLNHIFEQKKCMHNRNLISTVAQISNPQRGRKIHGPSGFGQEFIDFYYEIHPQIGTKFDTYVSDCKKFPR